MSLPADSNLSATPETSLETLSGPVERVTFHNPDNGFLQVKVRGRDELVPVVGHWALSIRENILKQAATAGITASMASSSRRGSCGRFLLRLWKGWKYLGSGLIKGIGSHYATRLLKVFGEQVFEVIENEPNRLLVVEGIGKGRLSKIVRDWRDQSAPQAHKKEVCNELTDCVKAA